MTSELYVKGDRTRRVDSPAKRVQAVWEGFKPAADAAEDATRVELQTVAKSLGIKANQSSDALRQAIAEHEVDDSADDTGEGDESDSLGVSPELPQQS